MKATGIVRRIDDLGRIVIPKEIRRTLHIHEGDAMEIYTDNEGSVTFKKYQHNAAEDILNLAADVDVLEDFSVENRKAARVLLAEIAEAAKKLKCLD